MEVCGGEPVVAKDIVKDVFYRLVVIGEKWFDAE
jgi:hypothetical protein